MVGHCELTCERGRVHCGEVAGVPAGLAPHHALHASAEVPRRRRRGLAHGGGAASAAAAAVESEQHGGEREYNELDEQQCHRDRTRD